MTVIQWVSDFSERIKQLQNISQAAASGGAKELKVGKHAQKEPRD
jgi:dynein heavy chain 1